MKGNFKATEALALLAPTKVEKPSLAKFSDAVAQEFSQIARSELENAVRAVLVGIGLHAVKNSVKHGEFDAWKRRHLTRGHFWSETTAMKNASLYMRLALCVVEEVRPPRTELLALAQSGTVTLSKSYPKGNISKFIERLSKFVGERSLADLLAEYGIKNGSSSLGGGGSSTTLPADNDTLAADAGQLLLNFDSVLLNPEHLKRFSAKQLDDMEQQLANRLEQFRQLKAKLFSGN